MYSGTPTGNRGKADQIFEPKKPTTLADAATAMSNSGLKREHINFANPGAGGQQVQNVFQFNLRVNNNAVTTSELLVGVDEAGLGDPQSQTIVGNRKSKERRPTSSHTMKERQLWSKGIVVAGGNDQAVQNPYGVPKSQVKRLFKKRP